MLKDIYVQKKYMALRNLSASNNIVDAEAQIIIFHQPGVSLK